MYKEEHIDQMNCKNYKTVIDKSRKHSMMLSSASCARFMTMYYDERHVIDKGDHMKPSIIKQTVLYICICQLHPKGFI